MTNSSTVKAKPIKRGHWVKVQIVEISAPGWSQRLENGKWVDFKYGTNEEVVMELTRSFDDHQEAEKFIESKAVVNLVKLVKKGGYL